MTSIRNSCPVCNEQFALKATLKKHLASNHSDVQNGIYFSGSFGIKHSSYLSTSTSSSLHKKHLAQEDSYKRIEVDKNHDPPITNTYEYLPQMKHLVSDSTNADEFYLLPSSGPTSLGTQWRCTSCNKVFESLKQLETHQTDTNHKEKITSTSEEFSGYETDTTITATFSCSLCKKSFDEESKLIQHNASVGHKSRQNAQNASQVLTSDTGGRSSAEDETSGYETAQDIFHCDLCKKTFEVEARYNQHKNSEGHKQRLKFKESIEAAKPKDVFPCNLPDCGRTFDTEGKLLQHQGMKHGVKVGVIESEQSGSEEFPCTEEDCGKVFPSKARMLQHVKDKHTIEKSNSGVRQLCLDCTEFNEEADAKPFIFLTFIAKHILTVHEKPGYVKGQCPMCQTKVEKQKNLLTHISRAHLFHRFKEEACFICLRLCKDKDDLHQHSTSVHRFKCTIDACHSMFPSKPLRDKHMLDKHQVYVCGAEECQRIFPTLDEKIEHMKLPHKREGDSAVTVCARGLANVHDGGILSEPAPYRAAFEPQPVFCHERNSADESSMRSTGGSVDDLKLIHRTLRDKLEDLSAFIDTYSSHLSQATNQTCSDATFKDCDRLKVAIDGVQRRLTPRVD